MNVTRHKPSDHQARAAEQGSCDAQVRLGLMYSTGQDVGQDYVSAHKWFNLAAVGGDTRASAYRAEIARDMSQQQIAQAQRLAREWKLRH